MQPLVALRAPKLFNLRTDPFQRAELEAGDYDKWYVEHAFAVAPAQAIVGQFLQSFQEFPPRQKPGSFSPETPMRCLSAGSGYCATATWLYAGSSASPARFRRAGMRTCIRRGRSARDEARGPWVVLSSTHRVRVAKSRLDFVARQSIAWL